MISWDLSIQTLAFKVTKASYIYTNPFKI